MWIIEIRMVIWRLKGCRLRSIEKIYSQGVKLLLIGFKWDRDNNMEVDNDELRSDGQSDDDWNRRTYYP